MKHTKTRSDDLTFSRSIDDAAGNSVISILSSGVSLLLGLRRFRR